MFGIGLPELIIIIVVALLVVGPSKLPELARSMGRALGEFRRMADDVKDTIEHEMSKPLDTEDEKKTGQEKQAETPAEEKMAEAQEATDQATGQQAAQAAAQATNQEAADAAAPESQHAEAAEPSPDETYLAEEEKRLLDENKEQVAKGTEVDEQKRT
jgi:sec-independent protein translocase protein TatB